MQCVTSKCVPSVSIPPCHSFISCYGSFSFESGLLILDTKPGWEGSSISSRGSLLYLILWHEGRNYGARKALEIG